MIFLCEIGAELVVGKCRRKRMQITDRYYKMRNDKEDNLWKTEK